jgi:hypothetical protein
VHVTADRLRRLLTNHADCLLLKFVRTKSGSGFLVTTYFSQPAGADGLTVRGTRSDRLSLLVLEKFRPSPILSLNHLFYGKHDSSWRRSPQTHIIKVSWPIERILITYTKNLLILFYFYLFCPNSLFQTSILFSLHPGGGLRRSRWPY